VRADVSIVGMGANPEDTVLSGGESGTILDVLGPDVTVDVQNLTFDRGAGLDVDHNSGGGGIYCEQQGLVNVENAAFTNNFANDGAAIYVRDCTLNVKSASFVGNTSDDDGGAVTVWYGHATLDDTHFDNNQALDGGAIAVFSGALTVTNSTFADSRATSFGGAIWMAYESDLVMSDTTIETSVNSGSKYGGALLIHGTAELDRVTLTDNEAQHGAGIYVSAGSVVDGNACNFANNDHDDIYAAGETSDGTAYNAGSNYSFTCEDHACVDR
jgi:predicted outer membrane repeat protein